MSKTRTILVDGDIVAYQFSASNERRYQLDDDTAVTAVDPDKCLSDARDRIDAIAEKLKADRIVVCLSDDFNNFRNKVLPSYKETRTETVRPEQLYVLKERLADHYETELWPNLEADDVMGILSTAAGPDEWVCIVSEDKDMKTIPGWLFNPAKDEKPRLISLEDADRFFFEQVITGDITDGYTGCPGAGPKLAAEVLDDGVILQGVERTISRGKNKGNVVTDWKKVPYKDLSVWDRILSVYHRYGLTEEHALQQARCAFILRNTHWDGSKPILWEPQKR